MQSGCNLAQSVKLGITFICTQKPHGQGATPLPLLWDEGSFNENINYCEYQIKKPNFGTVMVYLYLIIPADIFSSFNFL